MIPDSNTHQGLFLSRTGNDPGTLLLEGQKTLVLNPKKELLVAGKW